MDRGTLEKLDCWIPQTRNKIVLKPLNYWEALREYTKHSGFPDTKLRSHIFGRQEKDIHGNEFVRSNTVERGFGGVNLPFVDPEKKWTPYVKKLKGGEIEEAEAYLFNWDLYWGHSQMSSSTTYRSYKSCAHLQTTIGLFSLHMGKSAERDMC